MTTPEQPLRLVVCPDCSEVWGVEPAHDLTDLRFPRRWQPCSRCQPDWEITAIYNDPRGELDGYGD